MNGLEYKLREFIVRETIYGKLIGSLKHVIISERYVLLLGRDIVQFRFYILGIPYS